MKIRIAIVAAIAVVAVALPSATLAAPTEPVVHPVPATVLALPGVAFGISWEPSTFDLIGGHPMSSDYQVTVLRWVTGSPSTETVVGRYSDLCCSQSLTLHPGYIYVVYVSAREWLGCLGGAAHCFESSSLPSTVLFDVVGLRAASF